MQVYQSFNVSIVAVEYPGYGIYRSNPKACQEEIELDAEAVYRYMVEEMKVAQSRIILFGRSMGSGPACFIASKFNPKAVILMSPFSSIRSVVVQHASILGYLLKVTLPRLTVEPLRQPPEGRPHLLPLPHRPRPQ